MSTEPEQKPMELLRKELPQLKAVLALNAVEGTDVETLASQELEYLRMLAISKPDIMECMPQTVLMSVKAVLKQNLSMDPNAGLVYVKTRNVKIGQDESGNDIWRKALEITPSANGLISINRQCGRLLDVKNPVIQKDELGRVIKVSVEILVPSVPSPRWEERSFDESDFYRWKRASHKENARSKKDANADTMNYANENYSNFKGGIDPEFARAKAIRHGLKKLGTNQNEGKFTKIVISDVKQVIIDPTADNAAANDETNFTPYVEVIPDEKPASAIQPNDKFGLNNNDL